MKANSLLYRTILLAVALGIIFIGIFVISFSSKASTESLNTGYKSILIEAGDTIDELSIRYFSDSGLSFEKFKDEMRRLNGLYSDVIYAGDYLIIPVLVK